MIEKLIQICVPNIAWKYTNNNDPCRMGIGPL